jgi:hypothetical protein
VEHWRSGKWPHHNYTFFLAYDPVALETVEDNSWRALDAEFTSRGLDLILAHDHCGGILVVGQK